MACNLDNDRPIYLDSFEVDRIPEEAMKLLDKTNRLHCTKNEVFH